MQSKFKILIVDELHASITLLFEQAGISFDYLPDIPEEEVSKKLKDYDGLVLRSKIKVNADFIAQQAKLKLVARAGSGVETIDQQALASRHITLISTPEGNSNAVAEHALGLLLSLLNHIPRANGEVRQKIWDRERNRGTELSDKTVGIIGFGNNGSRFAQCLRGLGCRILANDIEERAIPFEGIENASLAAIQAEADILSLHIPINADNFHFVDAAFIRGFKKPFYLINTSRGEVVSTPALLEGLQQGKIKGAALDVLENEKLSNLTSEQQDTFERLKAFDNVILTPHIAGLTFESEKRINEILAHKIKHWIAAQEG
ncbi:MAG: phosphoglycerate dehydrogenase [Bernardetiaceae bacterium]|nr:phosphoglycerate dehydrogenase [Bernardetiaceae bacterium]